MYYKSDLAWFYLISRIPFNTLYLFCILTQFLELYLRSEEGKKETKNNMQITIETAGGKEGESSQRKVATEVDMENFTVVDEVG